MTNNLIIISEYSVKSRIDPAFIFRLGEEGLIEIQIIEGEKYIYIEQLPDLERYARWHYDLSVNVEGIDVIQNLLSRIENMQGEINDLRKRLQLFQ